MQHNDRAPVMPVVQRSQQQPATQQQVPIPLPPHHAARGYTQGPEAQYLPPQAPPQAAGQRTRISLQREQQQQGETHPAQVYPQFQAPQGSRGEQAASSQVAPTAAQPQSYGPESAQSRVGGGAALPSGEPLHSAYTPAGEAQRVGPAGSLQRQAYNM